MSVHSLFSIPSYFASSVCDHYNASLPKQNALHKNHFPELITHKAFRQPMPPVPTSWWRHRACRLCQRTFTHIASSLEAVQYLAHIRLVPAHCALRLVQIDGLHALQCHSGGVRIASPTRIVAAPLRRDRPQYSARAPRRQRHLQGVPRDPRTLTARDNRKAHAEQNTQHKRTTLTSEKMCKIVT